MVGSALPRVMVPFTPVMSTTAEFASALAAVIASRSEQFPLPPGLLAGQSAALPVAGSAVTLTVKVSCAEAFVAGARNNGANQIRLAKRKDRKRTEEKRREATTDDIHSTSQKFGHCSCGRGTRGPCYGAALLGVRIEMDGMEQPTAV